MTIIRPNPNRRCFYQKPPSLNLTELKHRAAILFCSLISFVYAHAQKPVANFKSDITGGCSPIVVNFQDLSTGGPTSWLWDFGNGAFSTLQHPSTTYFAAGTYKVTLSATNASGTHTIVKTSFITVYQDPVASFTANTRNGCAPFPIQFTDMSTTPAGTKKTGWKWDFGDGTSSTEQNPRHIYRTSGSFTVTLTVTNDLGCSHLTTRPNFIDIIPGVTANFLRSEPAVCSGPTPINFEATSEGPGTLRYLWDFGDGRTSTLPKLTHTYQKDGTYSISLAVTSSQGCSDTLKDHMITIGGIKTDFSVPDICPKNDVQFIDSSNASPDFSIWRFSDGTTDSTQFPYKNFDRPGTYTATLVNIYPTCRDSVTKSFRVAPIPTVAFTSDSKGSCKPPVAVKFQNQSTDAVSYEWDFGDGTTSREMNPTHTYTAGGTYRVRLVAFNASGCSDTLIKTDFIKVQKPTYLVNLPQRGCAPLNVAFAPAVITPDSVIKYAWNFGDGGTSDKQNPNYTYTKPGTYSVTLTVTTSGGCTETFNTPNAVKVGTLPKVDFSFDKNNVCASEMIQFSDRSAPSDEWEWDFGDGELAAQKNPLHRFRDIGTLSVKLTAYNNGCADSVRKNITIRNPVAKFAYQPECNNRLRIQFTDKSLGAQSWFWEFGDGGSSNMQNPGQHDYAAPGNYNVSLTVTNGSCSYKETRPIQIGNFTPVFSADVLKGCKPAVVLFKAANPQDRRIRTYSWNFGDGQVYHSRGDTTYVFNNPGVYNVVLTTIDTFNCQDTNPTPVQVRVLGPKAAFSSTTNQGCRGMTTEFKDETVSDGVNRIVRWTWDFGDGTRESFTGPPFTHKYDKVGRYSVKLIVDDAGGCSDSVLIRNFVRTSTFKMDIGNYPTLACPGKELNFHLLTNTRNYKPLWDFGDGNFSTASNLMHAFQDTGTYTIKLVITDTLGCKDSIIKANSVKVYRPIASFTANNLTTYCTPFEAKFTNTSSYVNGVTWDLAIGTSNQYNPTSYYTKTGTYPIKLIIYGHGDCADSITKTLRVYNPSDGRLDYQPQVGGCRPFPVDFEAFTDMNATFVWDFGDGTVIDTTVNMIRHVYNNFGNFIPKIILKEPSGCMVPLTGSSVIEIIGAKAKFEVNSRLFCDNGTIQISDSTTSREAITDYLWDFGDGTTSTSFVPPPHYYSQPGNYPVSLVVKTETGCTDTMRLQPQVKVVQSPVISINADSAVCLNEYVRYAGMSQPDTSALRWAWKFPNGNSDNRELPVLQQYRTAGSFQVSVVATNSSGCADTATQNMSVNPLPTVDLPATLIRQAGFPVQLPAVYSTGVEKYLWSPATNLNCTDCPQPEASPKFDTKYAVTFTDGNGCTNDAQIQIVVLCENANVFVPNTFSPNGDGNNDVFYVRGKGLDRVKNIRIYNRWGEIVFEKKDFAPNDAAAGWNGQFRGTKAQAGVYIYQVEVFCENGDVIRHEGNIALIH